MFDLRDPSSWKLIADLKLHHAVRLNPNPDCCRDRTSSRGGCVTSQVNCIPGVCADGPRRGWQASQHFRTGQKCPEICRAWNFKKQQRRFIACLQRAARRLSLIAPAVSDWLRVVWNSAGYFCAPSLLLKSFDFELEAELRRANSFSLHRITRWLYSDAPSHSFFLEVNTDRFLEMQSAQQYNLTCV